jgi:hypothetical protein
MSRQSKAAKDRIRTALAKGRELGRRMEDLDKCLSPDLRAALAAALAEEYAKLLEEYPDVFPAPPRSPEVMRADAADLREAQAAAEEAEQESHEAQRKSRAALNELTARPAKPDKPS